MAFLGSTSEDDSKNLYDSRTCTEKTHAKIKELEIFKHLKYDYNFYSKE